MEEKKLYNAVRKIITLADGRQIEIETGKLAKQADGSVVVKMGDTMLLGTVVAAKDAKPDTDFMDEPSSRSTPWNLPKSQRGILHTT